MNLYECRVENSGLQRGSQTIPLDAGVFERRPALRAYEGKSVIVGIRPEDFEDAALADSSAGHLTGTVALVEALGSELMVHFSVDAPSVQSGDPDAAEKSAQSESNAVGRFSPRSRVRADEEVEVAIDTDNLHFFDPETHLAIEDGHS